MIVTLYDALRTLFPVSGRGRGGFPGEIFVE